MNIKKIINNPRTIQAMLGTSKEELERLAPQFEQVLREIQSSNPHRIRKIGQGCKGRLPTSADKLFFTLFYLKVYTTFDVLGCFFDKGRGRSCEAIHLYTKVLKKVLGRELVLPERKVHSIEELFERFPEIKDVLADGVERKVQRPVSKKRAGKLYSGKKKIHAKKNVIVTDMRKNVIFLTPTKSARRHDKRLADKVSLFDYIPERIALWVDTGFQGVLKQHYNTLIPKKATKGKPLTLQDKEENKLISSFRVRVEHAIAGIKRFAVLAGVLRNRKVYFDDLVMELGCGMWNFHLKVSN
jgi:hypothetical protein